MQNRWPFICSVLPNRHFLPVLRLCKCLGGLSGCGTFVWQCAVNDCCVLCVFFSLGKTPKWLRAPGSSVIWGIDQGSLIADCFHT